MRDRPTRDQWAELVKVIRTRLTGKQADLARRTKISESNLSRYLNAKLVPDLATVQLIESSLGFKLGEITDVFKKMASGEHVKLGPPGFEFEYTLFESHWEFAPSARGPTWDAKYKSTREMEVFSGHQVGLCTFSFSRGKTSELTFEGNMPTLRLNESDPPKRSASDGRLVLDSLPRVATATSFSQDVRFSPAMTEGETARFSVVGDFPAHKLATRRQIEDATARNPNGMRSHDWASKKVSEPTRKLVLSVFLNDSLEAEPLGPVAGFAGKENRELSRELRESPSYVIEDEDCDSGSGVRMTLVVEEPQIGVWYRLVWAPPLTCSRY